MSTHRTADLGFARLDLDRAERTGTPEVVYAAGKTPAQTVACLEALHESAARPRLGDPGGRRHRRRGPGALARGGRRRRGPLRLRRGAAGTGRERRRLTAGTSDGAVAAEVAATLAAERGGLHAAWTTSGVAGVHRVLAVAPEVAAADAVVVVAGMDGALPSVVAGLTDRLVVAVPTSVGYGAAFEGLAALLTMLTACAPGVLVVNIDNGFGAGRGRRPHREGGRPPAAPALAAADLHVVHAGGLRPQVAVPEAGGVQVLDGRQLARRECDVLCSRARAACGRASQRTTRVRVQASTQLGRRRAPCRAQR